MAKIYYRKIKGGDMSIDQVPGRWRDAVLELLEGVPVRPFPGQGETITPTAMALLRALHAEFGPWPAMRVERRALVYGTHVFPGAPNGTVFAWGAEETDAGCAGGACA